VAPVHAQVGPDGAVWVSDWYNVIAQHNPTPVGFSNGVGNAYETSMRDHQRGRIYRVVYRDGQPSKRWALSSSDPAGLVTALGSDNMLWRLHAQRLLVERGNRDVVPRLIALTRNTSTDGVGINGAAMHALWTLHGLGVLGDLGSDAGRAAIEALRHPAAGVRKAAVMVLPRTAEAAKAILSAAALQDADLHTRLAVILALADMPAAPEIARALYNATSEATNYTDRWLSRALFAAAHRHKDAFVAHYEADPRARPTRMLPVALRLGLTPPDWATLDADSLGTDWKDMQVPGSWESRGMPDFDGVVWFTRTVDLPQQTTDGVLSLGRIGNLAEVWVNGRSLEPLPQAPAPAAPASPLPDGRQPPRDEPPLSFRVPAGVLSMGRNTLTVRIQNPRNDGGFLGTPNLLFLEVGDARVPLAGTWKHRVERQTNAAALYSHPGELAAHVVHAAGAGEASTPAVDPKPDVVIRVGISAGLMKFDQSELTATAGQLVELVLTNSDGMQHNFVLGLPGALQTIGEAADELARAPNGVALQYVPEIGQVLFATKLVEPGETLRVQFRVPSRPGQYPYVCTFPGHWRIMNGLLNVLSPPQAGSR